MNMTRHGADIDEYGPMGCASVALLRPRGEALVYVPNGLAHSPSSY